MLTTNYLIIVLIGLYLIFFVIWTIGYKKRKNNHNIESTTYTYFIMLVLLAIDTIFIWFIVEHYDYITEILNQIEWKDYYKFIVISFIIGAIGYSIFLTKEMKEFFYLETNNSIRKYIIYLLLFICVIISFLLFFVFIIDIDDSLKKCKVCGKRLTLEVIGEELISQRTERSHYYESFTEGTGYSERTSYTKRCYKVYYETYATTKQCSYCEEITVHTEEYEVKREEITCFSNKLTEMFTMVFLVTFIWYITK